jgi:hypothetical protein
MTKTHTALQVMRTKHVACNQKTIVTYLDGWCNGRTVHEIRFGLDGIEGSVYPPSTVQPILDRLVEKGKITRLGDVYFQAEV